MCQTPTLNPRALFIRRWGEMGANWGISRTMAEIHALLFVSSETVVHGRRHAAAPGLAGERQHEPSPTGQLGPDLPRAPTGRSQGVLFSCETNVWQMFEAITRERRRREVEPIVETINGVRA